MYVTNILGWGNFALGVGKFLRFFYHGAVEELQYSDAEMTMHCDKAKALENCKPWIQHLTPESIKVLDKAIKQKNYLNAREAVRSGAKSTAAPWCIDALLEATVLMCTVCPTIIAEASPCIYVFK